MSSLFLTQLADLSVFKDPNTGDLSAPSFLGFLGALLAVVNVFGAFAFSGYQSLELRKKEEEERRAVQGQRAAHSHEAHADDPHSSETQRELESVLSNPPRQPSENSPLLREEGDAERSTAITFEPLPLVSASPSFGAYLRSPAFWSLTLLLFAAAGGAEMVMSSVGSMVVSLLAVHANDASQIGKEELKVRTRLVGVLGEFGAGCSFRLAPSYD